MTRIFSILTIALCFAFSHTASAQDTLKVLPQSGDPQAQPLLGIVYVLAQSGDPQAQTRLGMVYFNGEGVAQDYAEAVRWWRLAAEQGDAFAQTNLGYSYANGEGVAQDYVEATRWWRLAAEQGNAQAQNRLGIVYFNGVGVPQDFVYSHMWFNISASLGAPDSAQLRDEVAKNMTPAQIALAQQLARECVRREYKDC